MKKLVRDIGKRSLSALMALIMCLSMVPDVYADEPGASTEAVSEDSTSKEDESEADTAGTELSSTSETSESSGGVYTVYLSDTDGGNVRFTDDGVISDDAERSYPSGSQVQLKLTPDDGYAVSEFVIMDTDGSELYKEDTEDDVFEFTMPEMDVTVSGVFKKSGETSEKTTEKASEGTSESTGASMDISDKAGDESVRLEGTGVKITGTYVSSSALPSYLGKMKSKTAAVLGTDTASLGSKINAAVRAGTRNAIPSGRVTTSGRGVTYCADLIDKSYAYATGFNINSSLARDVYNKLVTDPSNKNVFNLVYHDIAYTDSSKTINLRPGDIVFLSSKSNTFTFNSSRKTISSGDGCEHVFYVYAVTSNNKVYVVKCTGLR